MAQIEPPYLSTINIADAKDQVMIEMLQDPPIQGRKFAPMRQAGQLAGYYNATADMVELYMVSANGNTWLRVT